MGHDPKILEKIPGIFWEFLGGKLINMTLFSNRNPSGRFTRPNKKRKKVSDTCSPISDDEFYQRILDRSRTRFVEDLEPTPLLDLFIEREFLPFTEVRDIQVCFHYL